MLEKVYTPKEVSDHLRVSLTVVEDEIRSGRLRAMHIGNEYRIAEFDLAKYMGLAKEAQTSSTTSTISHTSLRPAADFAYHWPSGDDEQYSDAVEGTVNDGTRDRHVKIGFTVRSSAGKDRVRGLVLVDRYATVEFNAANDFDQSNLMASILKDPSGKQIPVGGRVPPEYGSLRIAPYNDFVKGPRASSNLAVVCTADDFETMLAHAVIRTKFKESSQNNTTVE